MICVVCCPCNPCSYGTFPRERGMAFFVTKREDQVSSGYRVAEVGDGYVFIEKNELVSYYV